jgi:hypothetical protein
MMRQFSGMGLFGGGNGGGIKGKMMRKIGGMMGMPDFEGMEGDTAGLSGMPRLPGLAPGSSKQKSKKRKKKRRK